MSETLASPSTAAADSGNVRIRIEGLAKEFGPLRVFQDVDLEIGTSEFVAIVGPSGCGKTTLLRCIAGLSQPTRARSRSTASRSRDPPEGVAMVFQHFGLFPWKTVYDERRLRPAHAQGAAGDDRASGCRTSSSWSA